MKYLRSIESFKKLKYQERIITTELQPIKEGFENDVTWGGSLLGRLINSTIRVIGVRYKATKIEALIQSFTQALDILLQEASSISEKKEAKTILAKMLLQEIYKLVMSEKTVEEKIEALLSVSDYKNRKSATGTPTSDSYKFKKPYKKIFEYAEQAEEAESEKVKEIEQGEEGMIDVTIAEVKKCELENKDVLIEKLEKFKSLLMEIDKEEAQQETQETQATQGQSNLFTKTIEFLWGYKDITRQLDRASRVSVAKPVESFNYYLEDEYLILEGTPSGGSASVAPSGGSVSVAPTSRISVVSPGSPSSTPSGNAWKYIVNFYSKLEKNNTGTYIGGLLDAASNPTAEDKEKVTKLGKKIVLLLTSDENYKPISIEKIKESNGSGNQDEEITKHSKIICSLARVILSLEKDAGLIKSFTRDVSEAILKMISSFDGMKAAAKEVTNEKNKFLKSYSDFRLILEADEDESSDFDAVGPDDDDEEEVEGEEEATETEGTEENKLDNVQIAWFDESNGGKGPFKKNEEKEWLVDIEQIKKPMGPEKEKINIDVADGKLGDPKLDLIIRIVNIFGKAYSLYATQYIPSGRPEGRVSQRTLREYEYIGKGDGDARGQKGDYVTPGEGPWAAKRVFEKWEDGVNEVLEDKLYRRVLANVTYVSQAERTSGVEQEGKKSGVTLMAFIIEMLTMKGTFKENKRNLLRKYFNIDAKDDKTGVETGSQGIRKDDAEKPDSPFFTKVEMYNSSKGTNPEVTGRNKIKKGYFYKAKIKIGNVPKNYILWVVINDKCILFRAQETEPDNKPVEESFITARFKESNFKYKIDKLVPPLKTVLDKSVLLVGIKIDEVNKFKKDGLINLYTLTNSTNIKTTTFTKNLACNITDLEIMVVSETTTNNKIQLKPVEIDWKKEYKATKDFPLSDDEVLNIKTQLKP